MRTYHHDSTPSPIPQHIVRLFEDLTFTVWEAGMDHYSARAIMHQIRWHHQIVRRDCNFKCNNNWTPALARMFMAKYPELGNFFELRKLKRPLDATERRDASLSAAHRHPPL